MKVIKKIDDLKIINENRPIALIPTMGNLHEGHISLVKQSKNLKLTSLVTIFINPSSKNSLIDSLKTTEFVKTL